MIISLSTIFTRTVINSLLLVVVVISLKNLNRNRIFNTNILFFIISLSILMITFPLEFGYTITIPSKTVMPRIQDLFTADVFQIKGVEIKGYMIIFATWIIGSLVKLTILIRQSLKLHSFAKLFSKKTDKTNVNGRTVNILHLPVIDSPSVVGLINPTIIIPDINLSKEEFDFIINHEVLHISNFDLVIKYLYEFIMVVYWWNPLGYIFKDKMDQILEIRVDEGVLEKNNTDEDKIKYVETLLNVSKQLQTNDEAALASYFAASGNKDLLLDRSKNILNYNKRKSNNKFVKFIFAPLLLLGFFLLSSIVFEPYTPAPEGVEFFELPFDPKISYIVKDGEDYSFCLDNFPIYKTNKREAKKLMKHQRLRGLKIYDKAKDQLPADIKVVPSEDYFVKNNGKYDYYPNGKFSVSFNEDDFKVIKPTKNYKHMKVYDKVPN
ncbi:M56 family metallopeptidase [Floricoccus tropicus]|nr:M56 family metallopeptidase [Floricoccus tropicus]